MNLQPIFPDADVINHQGRFPIQLEVPRNSSLTPGDVQKILALSSWQIDPNLHVDTFEGGRSVLIRRERPLERLGTSLPGLQISGIGYKPIEYDRNVSLISNDPFVPPSNANFISLVPGSLMSTDVFINGKSVNTRPTYRPLGAYLTEELRTKIANTNIISSRKFSKLAVPTVEAYGRYLGKELGNTEGQFGFAIFSAPDPRQERAGVVFPKMFFSKEYRGRKLLEMLRDFADLSEDFVVPLSRGLRELHDAGFTHQQMHANNFYLVGGKPFITDWATLNELGENREDNVSNRVCDIKRTPDDLTARLLPFVFPDLGEGLTLLDLTVKQLTMEAYAGEEYNFDTLLIGKRAISAKGTSKISDFDGMVQWMKDLGLEGFPKFYHPGKNSLLFSQAINRAFSTNLSSRSSQSRERGKAGRNEQCPCGSGRKYKRCCGK